MAAKQSVNPTGTNENILEGWLREPDPEQHAAACFMVCGKSYNADEARIFLDMLGLIPDPVLFPSIRYMGDGRDRRPAPGPRATLPETGYGAAY